MSDALTNFLVGNRSWADCAADLALIKQGYVMSQGKRESLPSKSFAVPERKAKKIGVAGEIKGEAKGKYPIPDKAHARNALARVSQFGTPAEKTLVQSKVKAKFPDIGEKTAGLWATKKSMTKTAVGRLHMAGIGAGIGGALGMAGQIKNLRLGASGESEDEIKARQSIERDIALRGAMPGGYLGKLNRLRKLTTLGTAQASREHPVKSVLANTLAGAGMGALTLGGATHLLRR